MRRRTKMQNITRLVADKRLLFVLVGICNTGIDFLLFNLGMVVFGLKPWEANLISTSVAMVFSFLANKHAVFSNSRKGGYGQFIGFVLVTLVGLWGLQTLIVVGASSVLHTFARQMLGLAGPGVQLLASNGAKGFATIASAIWNYVWYDRVIFARTPLKGKLEEWL